MRKLYEFFKFNNKKTPSKSSFNDFYLFVKSFSFAKFNQQYEEPMRKAYMTTYME